MATIGGIDPAFTGQTSGGEPPYVRLPDPKTLFARRAARFRHVAAGSEIADYLGFLADVATAQDRVAQAAHAPPLPDGIGRALEHGMPPLPRDIAAAPGALATLDALLAELAATSLGEGPAQVIEGLRADHVEDRRKLLQTIADGIFEIERLADGALAAAALQVWYALHAAQLDPQSLRNIGETLCPCCGGTPASSIVVNWPEAQGNRYLTCALCCAMWNHVRVKCTACGSTKGVSYRQIEGSTGDIGAEVCDTCQGYAKHLNQTKNASLDPVVDDVASYGLDMMLREEGWRRTVLNPFLVLT